MTSDVVSGPLGSDTIKAVWLLFLALVFKMIITVFTFGLKVRTSSSLIASDHTSMYRVFRIKYVEANGC